MIIGSSLSSMFNDRVAFITFSRSTSTLQSNSHSKADNLTNVSHLWNHIIVSWNRKSNFIWGVMVVQSIHNCNEQQIESKRSNDGRREMSEEISRLMIRFYGILFALTTFRLFFFTRVRFLLYFFAKISDFNTFQFARRSKLKRKRCCQIARIFLIFFSFCKMIDRSKKKYS